MLIDKNEPLLIESREYFTTGLTNTMTVIVFLKEERDNVNC